MSSDDFALITAVALGIYIVKQRGTGSPASATTAPPSPGPVRYLQDIPIINVRI